MKKDQHDTELPKDKPEKKDKKPREKKKVEYEGSRFASVILLILTVLAALFFSFVD